METTMDPNYKLTTFNGCDAQSVYTSLLPILQPDVVEIADLPVKRSWTNDEATLVLRIAGVGDLKTALTLGKLGVEQEADEFDWVSFEGDLYARLWWD